MDLMHFEDSKIPVHGGSIPASGKGQKMVVFGSTNRTDAIRKAYLELTVDSHREYVTDYGSFKRSELSDMHNLADILLYEDQTLPVFLCEAGHLGICLPAFIRQHHTLGVIDKNLSRYVDFPGISLAHTKLIAGQRHAAALSNKIHPKEQRIPLAMVRSNPQKAEVALRSIEIAVIHLDALRLGDNIGSQGSNTCGLTIEEMCQMVKYAGASMNLKAVIIAGYDEAKDVLHMMAKNSALLMYYLVEGYKIRCAEKEHLKNANTYTVMPDNLENVLTFMENRQSGRWWLQVEDESGEPALLPCTEKDYEDACQNIISERIMRIYAKI